MKVRISRFVIALLVGVHFYALPPAALAQSPHPGEELFTRNGEIGHYGGRLVVSLRSEPKTLNPVTSLDISSREVIAQMTGDLIHVNRLTQDTEPVLAKTWQVSPDGLKYTLHLRHGLRFSDGHPLDADDVIFSFKVYLDENAHSPQRDALIKTLALLEL